MVQPLGAASLSLTLLTGAEPGFDRAVVAVNDPPGSATAGAVSVSGCLTTTTADPLTPLTLTEIVAIPGATAVIVPLLLTVATLMLLLL